MSTDRYRSPPPGQSFLLVGSAEEYAYAVQAHALQTTGDSLYPGQNYENLSQYLLQPYKSQRYRGPATAKSGDGQDECFATLYDLSAMQSDSGTKSFADLDEFDQIDYLGDAGSSHLLFLRGNPTPEWLNTIGYKCNVDPEFYLQHLDFRATAGKTDYFSLPSLPSSASNILRLNWTTIGSRTTYGRKHHDQEEIESLRQEGANAMAQYLHEICLGHHMKTCDSFVRRFAVHDEVHFSFEQDVSICVNEIGQGRIVIVWLDVGNDLTEGPNGPWLMPPQRSYSWTTSVYPTIRHKPHMALQARSSPFRSANITATAAAAALDPIPGPSPNPLIQSASLLHRHYGRTLDPATARADPFYALDDLFAFTAHAESQFLNLMATKLVQETDLSAARPRHGPSLANLLASKQLLDRHAQHIQQVIATITSRGDPAWRAAATVATTMNAEDPAVHAAMTATTATAAAAAARLQRDFEYLLERARSLSAHCDSGMGIVMNRNMLAESQKAMEQAEGVARLTRLAFFYIPLSFTASFFGMNFAQFGQGELSIWLWFVVSLPVFLVSVMLLAWDVAAPVRRMVGGARRFIRRLRAF